MTEAQDLKSRILTAIRGVDNKPIVFHNLDEVPVGSSGYLTPGSLHSSDTRDAVKTLNGWMNHGNRIVPGAGWVFTSHSGPANDEKLAQLIVEELVPENHLLVDFKAVTGSEAIDSTYGLGGHGEVTWTTLSNKPQIIGHRLAEAELARLSIEIETVGSLNEYEVYTSLDEQIKQLGEAQAQELKTKIHDNPVIELFDQP